MEEIECLINKINEYLKSPENKPRVSLKEFITKEDIVDIKKIISQSVPNATDEEIFVAANLILFLIKAKEINKNVKIMKDSSSSDANSYLDLRNDAKEVYEMISMISSILKTQNQSTRILENLKNDIVFLEDVLFRISNDFRLYGERTNFEQIVKVDSQDENKPIGKK